MERAHASGVKAEEGADRRLMSVGRAVSCCCVPSSPEPRTAKAIHTMYQNLTIFQSIILFSKFSFSLFASISNIELEHLSADNITYVSFHQSFLIFRHLYSNDHFSSLLILQISDVHYTPSFYQLLMQYLNTTSMCLSFYNRLSQDHYSQDYL